MSSGSCAFLLLFSCKGNRKQWPLQSLSNSCQWFLKNCLIQLAGGGFVHHLLVCILLEL